LSRLGSVLFDIRFCPMHMQYMYAVCCSTSSVTV